ncbi:hypothetical protein DRH27_02225, partial [Candidatus Falkowbacteria bacterium]
MVTRIKRNNAVNFPFKSELRRQQKAAGLTQREANQLIAAANKPKLTAPLVVSESNKPNAAATNQKTAVSKWQSKFNEARDRYAAHNEKIKAQEAKIKRVRENSTFDEWKSRRNSLFNQLDALTNNKLISKFVRNQNEANQNLARAKLGLRRKRGTSLTSKQARALQKAGKLPQNFTIRTQSAKERARAVLRKKTAENAQTQSKRTRQPRTITQIAAQIKRDKEAKQSNAGPRVTTINQIAAQLRQEKAATQKKNFVPTAQQEKQLTRLEDKAQAILNLDKKHNERAAAGDARSKRGQNARKALIKDIDDNFKKLLKIKKFGKLKGKPALRRLIKMMAQPVRVGVKAGLTGADIAIRGGELGFKAGKAITVDLGAAGLQAALKSAFLVDAGIQNIKSKQGKKFFKELAFGEAAVNAADNLAVVKRNKITGKIEANPKAIINVAAALTFAALPAASRLKPKVHSVAKMPSSGSSAAKSLSGKVIINKAGKMAKVSRNGTVKILTTANKTLTAPKINRRLSLWKDKRGSTGRGTRQRGTGRLRTHTRKEPRRGAGGKFKQNTDATSRELAQRQHFKRNADQFTKGKTSHLAKTRSGKKAKSKDKFLLTEKGKKITVKKISKTQQKRAAAAENKRLTRQQGEIVKNIETLENAITKLPKNKLGDKGLFRAKINALKTQLKNTHPKAKPTPKARKRPNPQEPRPDVVSQAKRAARHNLSKQQRLEMAKEPIIKVSKPKLSKRNARRQKAAAKKKTPQQQQQPKTDNIAKQLKKDVARVEKIARQGRQTQKQKRTFTFLAKRIKHNMSKLNKQKVPQKAIKQVQKDTKALIKVGNNGVQTATQRSGLKLLSKRLQKTLNLNHTPKKGVTPRSKPELVLKQIGRHKKPTTGKKSKPLKFKVVKRRVQKSRQARPQPQKPLKLPKIPRRSGKVIDVTPKRATGKAQKTHATNPQLLAKPKTVNAKFRDVKPKVKAKAKPAAKTVRRSKSRAKPQDKQGQRVHKAILKSGEKSATKVNEALARKLAQANKAITKAKQNTKLSTNAKTHFIEAIVAKLGAASIIINASKSDLRAGLRTSPALDNAIKSIIDSDTSAISDTDIVNRSKERTEPVTDTTPTGGGGGSSRTTTRKKPPKKPPTTRKGPPRRPPKRPPKVPKTPKVPPLVPPLRLKL